VVLYWSQLNVSLNLQLNATSFYKPAIDSSFECFYWLETIFTIGEILLAVVTCLHIHHTTPAGLALHPWNFSNGFEVLVRISVNLYVLASAGVCVCVCVGWVGVTWNLLHLHAFNRYPGKSCEMAVNEVLQQNSPRGIHIIQINQPTRCSNFSSLLLDVYVQLRMFRASSRPSSGAQQLQ